MFRDYEELEYKKPVQTYTKTEILEYLNFCYAKVDAYFNNIEDNHLLEKNTVKDMPFIELLIYNTRHIQHHAAQLGLRVQQITGKELEWVSSGGIK
jgi:hypothetical protein